jgi:hypothetical protein
VNGFGLVLWFCTMGEVDINVSALIGRLCCGLVALYQIVLYGVAQKGLV